MNQAELIKIAGEVGTRIHVVGNRAYLFYDEELERFAELVRQDERERMNGIALTNIPHPDGNPIPDDVKLNPDSLETIEIDIPVMPEDKLETWMHNMIRACNRSTSDSDINVIKLIQHIENLYMQGRADERKRLNGVTAHEQQLIDGQASLMKVKK